MAEVYLVTSGSYSDYHVDGAFSTKELADEFVRVFGDSYGVETYRLDQFEPQVRAGLKPYRVFMFRDGSTKDVRQYGVDELSRVRAEQPTLTEDEQWDGKRYVKTGRYIIWPIVAAKDEQHAVKIVNEIRTRMIANNEWPPDKTDS